MANNASSSSRLQFSVSNSIPGATLTIYADGVAIGSAVVPAGSSSFTVVTNGSSRLTDGDHVITARQTVPGWAESVDSPPLTITIDATRPAAPATFRLKPSSDSGISNSDLLTNVDRPSFDIDVSGLWQVRENGFIATPTIYSSGATYDVPYSLTNGPHTFVATAVDDAGNVSDARSVTITVDTLSWQPGAGGVMDTGFGTGGTVMLPGNYAAYGHDVARQADGKLVIAGLVRYPYISHTDVVVTRVMPNGTLDTSFATKGWATLTFGANNESSAEAVLVLPDGKILVGGDTNFRGPFLARYLPDGTLDATFGSGGIIRVPSTNLCNISELRLLPTGKILAGGTAPAAVGGDLGAARFNADGSVDTTFGIGGLASIDFGGNEFGMAMDVAPDGKIVLSGREDSARVFVLPVARLTSSGQIDTSWRCRCR